MLYEHKNEINIHSIAVLDTELSVSLLVNISSPK